MKKTLSKNLAISGFIISILASCSKEVITAPNPDQSNVQVSDNRIGIPSGMGTIFGRIDPAGRRVTITLINELQAFGPIYPDFNTGYSRFADIPEGTYKMVLTIPDSSPSSTVFQQTTSVMEIKVKANEITDLGLIKL